MTVSYQKLAKTDLLAECRSSVAAMDETGEFPVEIEVRDEVFHAIICKKIKEYSGVSRVVDSLAPLHFMFFIFS